mmetsp:Transcript_37141/g.48012  ORF Transcript_37141/g.48012 Transcript_37141/m.48012 type:complete len:177 (-) Transcript_37141:83-613(-)
MFSDNCLCVLLQWTLKVRLRRICAVSCRSLLGDIVSLAPLKELESLDLRYCSSVGGDVGGLVQLSHKLKEIMLDNTIVTGSLDSFKDQARFVHLESLRLEHLTVHGRLSSLAHLSSLSHLHLSHSSITGALKDLSGLVSLKTLHLAGLTNILGSTKDIGDLILLQELWLSSAQDSS